MHVENVQYNSAKSHMYTDRHMLYDAGNPFNSVEVYKLQRGYAKDCREKGFLLLSARPWTEAELIESHEVPGGNHCQHEWHQTAAAIPGRPDLEHTLDNRLPRRQRRVIQAGECTPPQRCAHRPMHCVEYCADAA